MIVLTLINFATMRSLPTYGFQQRFTSEAPLVSSSRVEQVDMRAGSQSPAAAIGEQNSTVAEEQASSRDGAVLVGTPSIIEPQKITASTAPSAAKANVLPTALEVLHVRQKIVT